MKKILSRIVPERTGGTTGSTGAKSSSSNNSKNKNRTEMLKYCNNNNNNIKTKTKKQIEGGNQSLVTRSTMLVGIVVLVVVLIMILMIPMHPAAPPPPKIMSTILFYYSFLLSASTGTTNTSTRIYNITTRTRSDDKSILSSSSSSTKILSRQQPEGSIKIWPRVQDIRTIRKNDFNKTTNDIDKDNATTTTTTTSDTNNETTYQIYSEDIIFQYYLVKQQQQQRQQPSDDDTNNNNNNNTNTDTSSKEDTNTNTNNNMNSEYEPIIIPTTTKTTSDTNFLRTILEQAEQRFRLALQHLTTPEYDVRTNYSSDLIDSNTGRKSDCNRNINNNDNYNNKKNNNVTTTTRSATSLYPILRYIRIYIRTNDTILDSTTDESYNISIVAPSTTTTAAAGSRNGLQQQQQQKEQEPISSMTMLLLNPTDNITTQIERKLSIQQENNTTIDDENVNDNSNTDNEPAIEIYATNVYGVLHAVQTIRQLMELGGYCNCTDNAWYEYATGSTSTKTTTTTTSRQTTTKPSSSSSSNCNASSSIGSDIYYNIRDIPIHIIDYPRYSYRGLLIDTARHYLPLSLIQTNLNIMEMNKMNILHWHITDTQSFPYQSKTYPELSYNGSYCPTCIYTYDDVQSIMYEGQIRGIRVILEYDLPGHSEAIGKSHPEFLTNCSSIISEPLDVTKESVYTFVNNLYDEIGSLYNIQNLTKSSTADLRYGNNRNVQQQQQYWVHIGGDEVDIDSWKDSESIRQYMEQHNVSDVRELLYQFENRLLQKVQQMNFRPIVWQELYDSGTPLPLNTIIDVWKLSDYNTTSYNATADGYDIIFSNCWYLDHLNMDWTGLYNCNPMQYIEANPSSSSSEQAKHILGGHASMWGERIDSSNLLPTVWPRASAVAEILWSGHPNNRTTTATTSSSELSTVHGIQEEDIEVTEQRLIRFRCLMMRQLQVLISPIAPGTCIDIV